MKCKTSKTGETNETGNYSKIFTEASNPKLVSPDLPSRCRERLALYV